MTNNRFLEYCVTGFKDLFSYISCSMKLRMRTKLNLHLLTDFETVELIKNGYVTTNS